MNTFGKNAIDLKPWPEKKGCNLSFATFVHADSAGQCPCKGPKEADNVREMMLWNHSTWLVETAATPGVLRYNTNDPRGLGPFTRSRLMTSLQPNPT